MFNEVHSAEHRESELTAAMWTGRLDMADPRMIASQIPARRTCAGRSTITVLLIAIVLAICPYAANGAQQYDSAVPQNHQAPSGDSTTVFRANVRRVVVDVVVTDSKGQTVSGLTKTDFSVAEDGKRQQILSFDANGFGQAMDYVPPKLPPEPPNTFVNLPTTPERGPLYVLLLDLVNMDNPYLQDSPNDFSIQMYARQGLVKFIKDKPEGSRFAVFVWSNGLHLVQGFTSDKAQLLAAVDPNVAKPVIPKVFMLGLNYGKDSTVETLRVLGYIAEYLDGLPGRKNLIWFSGTFPLSLFPNQDDAPAYAQKVKKTLDLMAQDQIAIYPVDGTGVTIGDPRAPTGATGGGGGMTSDGRDKGIGGGSRAAAAASGGTDGGQGYSLIAESNMTADEIAHDTGGQAYHGRNDIAGALTDATENGESYYTLSYSPSNQNYDGNPRRIRVDLARKGYTLSYRRAYFGGDTEAPIRAPKSAPDATPPPRKLGDTLYANMEHGAPIAHQLIFGAHLRTIGAAAMGTPEQMADLATQPAYFKVRHNSKPAKPLPPVKLQRYAIDYTVMAHQLQVDGEPLNLELAVAAYDADGKMLNALVNNGASGTNTTSSQPTPKSYRAEQQLDVPVDAAWIRVAVRDANTDRIGAMEVKLPLVPENESAAMGKTN
jgi:VWFA-related protein